MWSLSVVERQVAFQALLSCADGLVGVQINLLVFDTLPEASTNSLSRQPLPVHADLDAVVSQKPRELLAGELHPWSVLKMVGVPYREIASCSSSRRKSVVSVLDSRQASTRRLAQSRTAKIDKAPRHRLPYSLVGG